MGVHVFIALFLILAQLEHPEPILPKSANYLNIDSCPLILHISSKNRYVMYENHSTGTISSIRFGCVEKQNSTLHVVKEYDPEKLKDLLPSRKTIFFTAAELSTRSSQCAQFSSKFAVVFVGFSDGGAWRLINPPTR